MVTLTPSFARDVSDAFIIVIMKAINCCFNKYDHLLHVYQIKRAEFKERHECVIISNANRLLKEFANMKGL